MYLHCTKHLKPKLGLHRYRNDEHACSKFIVIGNVKKRNYIVKMMYALATIKSMSLGSELINPVPLSFT